MSSDLRATVVGFLRDAHSIEVQSLRQLESAPGMAGEPGLARALGDHLEETEEHELRLRGLLDARGASPERLTDNAKGADSLPFALFALAQRQAPSRLAAQVYAYEALETAGYRFLERLALRAEDFEVAEAAREIREEEEQMMERIEGLFDATVAASIGSDDDARLAAQLRAHLAEAHAIEAHSIELLESGKKMIEHPTWRGLFDEHLVQTRHQQKILEQRIESLGGDPSVLEDAALKIGGLNWSTFFGAQRDPLPKFAAFMFAFEHLEAGGYEQLRRVADRAGDLGTEVAVDQILFEERRAADRFAEAFDVAIDLEIREPRSERS
jgi:ferritin-like metal-binding protein YciE